MGVSTDGILFYGISISPEDVDIPWKDDEEPEIFYAKKKGLLEPTSEFSENTENEYREYWSKRDFINKSSKCKVITHCSYDYPMYGICISKSYTSASRGYPEEIKSLKIEPDWNELLRMYCEVMEIKFEQPKWILCSLWGITFKQCY
jgi:hypothetical protein